MERFVNFIAKHWYYTVIFTLYGATIFYIGGLNNHGWERVAGVEDTIALGFAVILIRLVVTVFICTKGAFLVFELTHVDKDCYNKEDIWFQLVNFVLVVYMTELAIIDILLHGI